ncbi:hypothetical protein NAV33_07425 [Pseudomonas stutzeri]|uniref:hypothetical protein n=1 Tax=Stutzerimonas stutzeri TaxID=316 RepID=UPI00210CD079|nr:hypothetical protein [Stutzerimonas stutzeri]MCQ4311725.1 hypothetical protein [Stutzerimonas stutzeri]
MEHIRINIETGNSAFEDEPATEVARILRKLADQFENGDFPQTVRDINGNLCGEVIVSLDCE